VYVSKQLTKGSSSLANKLTPVEKSTELPNTACSVEVENKDVPGGSLLKQFKTI
jgi:hypothetical protein